MKKYISYVEIFNIHGDLKPTLILIETQEHLAPRSNKKFRAIMRDWILSWRWTMSTLKPDSPYRIPSNIRHTVQDLCKYLHQYEKLHRQANKLTYVDEL